MLMKKSSIFLIIVAIVVLIGAAAAGVVLSKNNGDNNDRETVTVTMGWEAEIIEDIAGDDFNVEVMLPAGTSPHVVYSTPSNVANLYNSAVYFEVGTDVEWEVAFLEDVKEDIPDSVEIVNLSESIAYVGMMSEEYGEGDEYDAHIWTSPEYLTEMAKVIEEKLTALNPDHAGEYAAGLEGYTAAAEKVGDAMQALADRYTTSTAESPYVVMVWHPAWVYFLQQYAADYGIYFDMVSVESNGDVTADKAIEIIENNNGSAIFVSGFDEGSTDAVKEVMEKNGITVYTIDPTSENMLAALTEFIGDLDGYLGDLTATSSE